MKVDIKMYDKNGTLLANKDRLTDGYDKDNWLTDFDGEWYISGNRDMWCVEEFRLEAYKDGILLVDFEKVEA